MEYLKQHEPHFIGISVHNYNGDDAMVCPDYPNIFTGSPTSVIDRKNEACDAYYGTFGPLGIRTDFATYNADDMLGALYRALGAYQNKEDWNLLRDRAFASDFSWSNSADAYKSLYKSLLEKE